MTKTIETKNYIRVQQSEKYQTSFSEFYLDCSIGYNNNNERFVIEEAQKFGVDIDTMWNVFNNSLNELNNS